MQAKSLSVDQATLELLLTEASTQYGWQDKSVAPSELEKIYDIAKMGPTSLNQQPMRIVFLVSKNGER